MKIWHHLLFILALFGAQIANGLLLSDGDFASDTKGAN